VVGRTTPATLKSCALLTNKHSSVWSLHASGAVPSHCCDRKVCLELVSMACPSVVRGRIIIIIIRKVCLGLPEF
jgi:hypothetical protein